MSKSLEETGRRKISVREGNVESEWKNQNL